MPKGDGDEWEVCSAERVVRSGEVEGRVIMLVPFVLFYN